MKKINDQKNVDVIKEFALREKIDLIYNAIEKSTEKRKEQGFSITHKKKQIYELGFKDAIEWLLSNYE